MTDFYKSNDPKSATVAVGYLLRGADENWNGSADRFLASYRLHDAGHAHTPYVILKGFAEDSDVAPVERRFRANGFEICHLDDDGLDITAYARCARNIDAPYVCFFNTHSEILADNWLAKYMFNILQNEYSMVAATGSFESLHHLWSQFPPFPNIHLRSNSFCLTRDLFLELTENLKIETKLDAFRFESGKDGVTARISRMHKRVAVVGRDGRAFGPRWWPFSGTFRQGTQSNLLVGDNVTRTYDCVKRLEKQRLVANTWGPYMHEDYPLEPRTDHPQKHRVA